MNLLFNPKRPSVGLDLRQDALVFDLPILGEHVRFGENERQNAVAVEGDELAGGSTGGGGLEIDAEVLVGSVSSGLVRSPPLAKRRDYRAQYSSVFIGNSTFNAPQSRETVRRWAKGTAPGFRFSLKFPKTISHEEQFVAAEAETAAFLDLLSILNDADRLGPSFLQVGSKFDRRQFEALRRYLEALPRELPFAVEVRHRDYFDNGPIERSLDELLSWLHIDRVLFDSRALFSAPLPLRRKLKPNAVSLVRRFAVP